MKPLLVVSIPLLFACQKGVDPYTAEMNHLADETQKLRPPYEEFEKKTRCPSF